MLYIHNDDYLYENVLGFLSFVLFDFNLDNDIKNNLEINQQTLVTPYDIHDTLIDIAFGEENSEFKSRFGKSLFRYINAKERNCEKYEELTKTSLCRCLKY